MGNRRGSIGSSFAFLGGTRPSRCGKERTVIGTFEYVSARTVDEVCCRLGDAGPSGRPLAGGTDLLVDIRNGAARPALLVDIKRLPGFDSLRVGPSGEIKIGAGVSLNRIAEEPEIRRRYPGLAASAVAVGTYPVRNRATLVGNLCNASPAADTAPVLLALGAVVTVVGSGGVREIALRGLFAGPKRTTLAIGEIVCGVRIPPHGGPVRTAFAKQQRVRGHDLAIASVGGAFFRGSRELRIAIGSCAPTPILLDPIEFGEITADEIVERVAITAARAVSPISDLRATTEYRRAVLPVLIRRVIERLLGPDGGER